MLSGLIDYPPLYHPGSETLNTQIFVFIDLFSYFKIYRLTVTKLARSLLLLKVKYFFQFVFISDFWRRGEKTVVKPALIAGLLLAWH